MPRRNQLGLACSIQKVRLKDGSTARRAYVELPPRILPDGSKKRSRLHTQAETIPLAVARLVLALRQKGFQKEAERLRESALTALGAGFEDLLTDAQPHTTPLLGDVLADHIEARHRDGKINDETHTRYVGLLRNHIAPHPIARKHLDEVSREDVERFTDDLVAKRNEKGKPLLGTSPRRTIHDLLSQVFVKAAQDEVIPKNPMLTVERAKKKREAAGAQFPRKAGAARMLSQIMRSAPYEDYLRQLFLCLGMRTSERLGLRYDRFEWSRTDAADPLRPVLSERSLHVHVSHQLDRTPDRKVIPLKTEESPRILPMPSLVMPHVDAILLRRAIEIVRLAQTRKNAADRRLLAALRKHPQRLKDDGLTYDSSGAVVSPVFSDETFLFTNAEGVPHRQQRANVLWRKTLTALGVKERIREQDPRHVAVSFLSAQKFSNVAIASITGHSQSDTRSLTATYLHITEETREEEMDCLGALYARPAEPVALEDIPKPLLAYAKETPLYTLWRPPFINDSKLSESASNTDREVRGLSQRYLPQQLRTVSLADDSEKGATAALSSLSMNVVALDHVRGYVLPTMSVPATVEQVRQQGITAIADTAKEPTRDEKERELLSRIQEPSDEELAELNANSPAMTDEEAQEMAARLRADLAARSGSEHGLDVPAFVDDRDEPLDADATSRLAQRLIEELEEDD